MDEFTKAQRLILKYVSSQSPCEEISEDDIRDMDLMEFYWYAVNHKISGYIFKKGYDKLNSLGTKYKTLGKFLEKNYLMNCQKSRIVGEKLLPRITEKLEENNIEFAVIKGAINTFRLYDSIGERQFNDIDLLINKRDLHKVKDLLKSIGLQQKEENHVQTKYFEMVTHQTMPFEYEDVSLLEGKINIDVNFGFAPNNMIKINSLVGDILKRRCYVDVFGKKIPTLSPEDMFIYLLIHIWRDAIIIHKIKATKDIELYQYLELNQLMDRYPLDWKYIEEFCINNQLNEIVYFTLYHALYISPRIEKYCGELYRKIEPADKEYLSMFGNENQEPKKWNISFGERIFCLDRYNKLLEVYKPEDFEAFNNREKIFKK